MKLASVDDVVVFALGAFPGRSLGLTDCTFPEIGMIVGIRLGLALAVLEGFDVGRMEVDGLKDVSCVWLVGGGAAGCTVVS